MSFRTSCHLEHLNLYLNFASSSPRHIWTNGKSSTRGVIELTTNVLKPEGLEAEARTSALKGYIDGLLDKYNNDMPLMRSNDLSKLIHSIAQ